MYGGGIKHNYRPVVKAMTYRKGGIFQHCTIGGLHPWYTDNMLQLPAIEADLFNGLKQWPASTSRRCAARLGGLSNIAYAKIKPLGGGDSKQALGVMLTCSKQGLPKIAMVFDDRRRHLGRPGGAGRHGLPLHAAPRHGAARRPQHHDRRPEDATTLPASPRRSAWTAPSRWGPSGIPTIRPQHRLRPRRSAGRRRDHDGRGADEGHGGVHRAPRRAPGRRS